MAPKSAAFSAQYRDERHGLQAPGRPLPEVSVALPALRRQLRTSCSSHRDCESCNLAWPACAWCGTTASCMETTPELISAGAQAEHVVYSKEEYRRTYGGETPGTISSNTCGIWVVNSASCPWVEGYCANFRRAATCPECKQLGGCGYCYRPGGHQSGCFSGSVSGPVRLSEFTEACQSPNDWIFGNWTRYYATDYWDYSCLETCEKHHARETGGAGVIRMGSEGSQVFYAPRSDCSWEIRPLNWPEGFLLEVVLQYASLAAAGDILRLSTSEGRTESGAPWSARELVAYAGCSRSSSTCIGSQTAYMTEPAVVSFASAPRSAAAMGGVWSVTWRLVPAHEDGIPIRSFVWMGLAMVLIPMLTILLWAIWCRRRYRRRGGNFGSSLERDGMQSSVEAVDIGHLENQNPECRPRIIGSSALREGGEAEEAGSSGAAPCSVCLRELAEGEEARSLPCGHHFHRPCIDLWLGRSTRCPLCRQPVLQQPTARPAGAPPPAELATLRASAGRQEETQASSNRQVELRVTVGRSQDAADT